MWRLVESRQLDKAFWVGLDWQAGLTELYSTPSVTRFCYLILSFTVPAQHFRASSSFIKFKGKIPYTKLLSSLSWVKVTPLLTVPSISFLFYLFLLFRFFLKKKFNNKNNDKINISLTLSFETIVFVFQIYPLPTTKHQCSAGYFIDPEIWKIPKLGPRNWFVVWCGVIWLWTWGSLYLWQLHVRQFWWGVIIRVSWIGENMTRVSLTAVYE